MIKLMKTKILSIAFFVLFITAISCSKNDGYSLGTFRISIATVKLTNGNSYSLILDNGKSLWPAASDIYYKPVNNQRVFVNYTILSDELSGYDHYVKVNDIWNILTKDVIELTTENADSIGHDPVNINEMWIGSDFLNIDFMFNFGRVRPHAINLVKNMSNTGGAIDTDTVELEFRHNAYNSHEVRLIEGLASFDLKPLQKDDVDSVNISILVKEFDKEKKYNVVYRYNNEALNNIQHETPVLVVSSDEYY